MAGPLRVRVTWIGVWKCFRKVSSDGKEAGARIWMPMFRILEAETYVKAGRDEAALQAIEQALAEGGNTVSAGLRPRRCASRPAYCCQRAMAKIFPK